MAAILGDDAQQESSAGGELEANDEDDVEDLVITDVLPEASLPAIVANQVS